MKAKHALVCEPSHTFSKCVTSHRFRHTINVALASQQHKTYCDTLSELGLERISLPSQETYPDSCFIEDNAIIHHNKAFITRMGEVSRRGEEESVKTVLQQYLTIKQAVDPATIEGGDVVHLSDGLISGITTRTNLAGIAQMKKWLEVKVDTVLAKKIVHLKSYMTYLGNNTMIATKSYMNEPILETFDTILVPEHEKYAANTLKVNGTILMPESFPVSKKLVQERGFDVITLNMSEFEKCEGALTCLSLLF